MRIPFLTTRSRAANATVRLEAKASRTGPLIAFQSNGRPAWTPRDYAALAREGYARNAIVYRCVRLIAEASASVPWLLYDGAAEVDEHPLLALLAKPNRRQAGADFREALAGYLLVAGNAYVEAVSVDGNVRELHTLRPDRMKVVPGGDGWPEAYEYTVGGRTVRFAVPGDGQRYFEKSYVMADAPGTNGPTNRLHFPVASNSISNGTFLGVIHYRVTKRAVPTVTIYGFQGGAGKISDGGGNDLAASSGIATATSGDAFFNINQSSGGSVTTSSLIVICNWAADAEL